MKSMDFEVQVVESSFVKPTEPAPRKGLWLSSLDLVQANKGHTPTIYLYSSNDVGAADFFNVARLKEAMAKALVAFYPLAGRLGVNDDDGRMEISCTGEGALFVVAQAGDLTVDDVKEFKPSARDIGTVALGSVATRIKSAIERMDDELVRSAIDYFEMAGKDKRPTLRGTLPPTDLHITSWFGRPQYDADFGWGKPQFMSRAESVRGGYVYLMNDEGTTDDGGGSGDIRVLVCMEYVNIKELGRLLYAKL